MPILVEMDKPVVEGAVTTKYTVVMDLEAEISIVIASGALPTVVM